MNNQSTDNFRAVILRSVMLIAMAFSALFGLMHDLGANDIGPIHSKVDYVYSIISALLLLALWKNKISFHWVAILFLGTSLLTFTSALIFVLHDEFRIIWFYFLIYVTYIALGSRAGMIMTVLTLLMIMSCDQLLNLQISSQSFVTTVLGLLIASLLSRVYTVQMERYETQLEKKNQTLQTTVQELDVALKKANSANKTKSLFLANMSHEIRTPMNGVIGMAQALEGTELNEVQQYYLQTLNSSGKNLLLLIDDLLDISKVESATLKLNIAPFETFSWITDIHNVVDPLFDDKQCAFITEIDDSLPKVLIGDETRLLQIIVNLLSNAAKFTEQGEVRLSIQGALNKHGQCDIDITVSDTGKGIPSCELESIFYAFQQVAAERIKNKGVGLGLAICKHLCKLMQGNLSVSSEPNKGSVFRFNVSLPVADETVMHDQDTDTIDVSADYNSVTQASWMVLLVDDDAINRLAASTLLQQQGHQVVEAEDGEQALQKIQQQVFDVVLMDIHMPVMDGITATRKIRESATSYANIPVIGLTASVMIEEKDNYLKAGMNAVAEKPIIIERLIRLIQQQLESA